MQVLEITGNLTKSPDLRYLPDGRPVTTLPVAVNSRDRDGEHVTYYNVNVYGSSAEASAKYLEKGSKVYAEGRYHMEEWTDRENKKRFNPTIDATDVQFLSKPSGARPQEGAASEIAAEDQNEFSDDIPF